MESPSDSKTAELKSVFLGALEISDAEQRTAYLVEACGDNAELRSQVESLLKAHERAGGFLKPVALDPDVQPDQSPLTEGPGTIIGRYKLLEKIGEGGMAVVYMAEQQEPVRRKVALKIIKLGMDTRQVIARFEAERQALALMDHPCIAKVHDAGATETGRPYFVMELVQGVSITEYCDRNSLSTKDRLGLFIQVCSAVQHAHQKGIIHRDLKPSNVMVTHHDGKPVPKVIDFGIAKAINQKLTEKTLFTRYAHLIGTPAYMSPEQAELSDLDIDTRADIYSLGVLLYELLTGTTPFSEEELRRAGYIEMQRVIREQEPVKPSTKLTTLGDTLTDIAKHRGCTPDLLRRALRGDLDWIVMKSLEKDRARRYDTASGLAEEIRRYLGHEPVLARGPSTTYRLQKFLHRHRVHVGIILGLAAMVVAVGTILSLWNRDRAQLVEAEGFKHRGILSQARERYAKAEREAALETIEPILASKHVGPEARLLQATILVDNRRSDEAVAILSSLLNERPEVAGAAHALLARILWEGESPDAETLKQIEEHRRQAEALLPETAEAYFLRAMTAVTVKEQLASLDKALQLDPAHYESRRLRAFTYYASRKYEKMKDDALGMTILRPRDPLGYSLRGTAWRELGRYKDAVADYDSALAFTPQADPQHADLSIQRCETLLRMGEYERVVADAQVCSALSPDKAVFQYHIFCALTALGEYDKATALFRQIINSDRNARSKFQNWCMKYVFDTLEARRSWHPANREPVGVAFLPMVEAEETYRSLSAKGQRVVADGFTGNWSPDGTKLAFSLGFVGNSGVAVFDPVTKETDLLIVPGKDPRWSPDGRYIAFVRDCELLRSSDLATAAPEIQSRPMANEEVWIIRPDGTGPRRLARGGWPSWSWDSNRLYYQSRADKMFCSISVEGTEAQPTAILPCADTFPAISPDETRVAYLENASLKVKDLVSQKVVSEWPAPLRMWGGPAWSPTGKELCLGGVDHADARIGLWIYPVDGGEPAKVLSGQTMMASWTRDQTKFLFTLGSPYYEIWTAPLDPKVPAVEALGPARTLKDHYRQIAALYTRRIQADPLDAYAYLQRAQQYHCLHEERKVRADMRRYTAIVTQGEALDVPSGAPWDIEYVIDGPFDYQLVVFLERQEDGMQLLGIAFGQKGRCEMKLFEIPMVVTSLLGLCLLPDAQVPAARADFTFGPQVHLGPIVNSPQNQGGPVISRNGLELYFTSDRPGGYGDWDIWVSKRASVEDPWGPVVNPGPGINGTDKELWASISSDGLTLYLQVGTWPNHDIYTATRPAIDAPWGPRVNLGPVVNSPASDQFLVVSPDDLELYFGSQREGGLGWWDIYVSTRATRNDPWGPPVNLGPTVNTGEVDVPSAMSPDGLILFIVSTRPGGFSGRWDTWMTRRPFKGAAWGAPVNLGPSFNTPPHGWILSSVSADGRWAYLYESEAFPVGDLWTAPILPNCDFNGDGKVDAADMAILEANWGKNEPLCDIGPFPWGDGVVDEKDLAVFMESSKAPGSKALDVPCDVVLSWIGPSFAESYDVYFGTSVDDVSNATREDPCGVLVSEGQAETTYNPQGLLEFSKTYCWRVDVIDVVAGSLEPVIYKGPVFSFTTEAYAYPTQNVVAKASSFQRGMGPEKTVDGSGLDENDGHSTESNDMWLSKDTGPHWIQYEFDQVYTLHELWVWNSNQLLEPSTGFGAKTVKVEYSADGTTWSVLEGVPEFAQAPGQAGYAANTIVNFGGVSAKYVKLTIEKGWGATPTVGLSEVRFFYIPDRSAYNP
ncbi:MAG: protein kinase domain-containing protein [Solirubrobacterales bacterium]